MKTGKAKRFERLHAKPALAPRRVSPGREWWFRLAAAVVIPLLLFSVAELGLRLVGYGYPTGFFLERSQEGRRVAIENRQFGWRFFPPHLARIPQPLVLTVKKPADACRIFFFGESAAMGDPDPDFGPPRALEVILRDQFPGKQVEVVNVAMTAINSHAVREIARDCASREGDVWVVYMGNNEVIGPFGAGTIFGTPAPPWSVVRLTLELGRSRLVQFLKELIRKTVQKEPVPRTWGGLSMFLGHQVRSDDPRLQRIRDHYRRNLEEIIRLGIASRVKMVVCTVASNLKECAPFGSQHRPDLSSAQLHSWEEEYNKGVAFEKARDFATAATSYERAAAIDDSFAALQFRLGQCLLALGKPLEARQAFERARDEDSLRVRCDARNNEIVRAVAANSENKGVYLADLEEQLGKRSPGGIPGLNFFWEHVHFNFPGTYAMAEMLARQVAEVLPESFQRGRSSDPLLSEMECARRLSYCRWNDQKIMAEILRRHQSPPCTLQLDHEERATWWRTRLAEGQRSGEPAALLAAIAGVRTIVQTNDSDWVLHKNLGQMLEAAGDLAGAFTEWERVSRMVPQYANAWYHLGNLLDEQGKSVQAEAQFRKALAIDPNMAEALSGLGLSLAAQGRFDEAFRIYARAIAANPDSIHAYINWGIGLAGRGQFEEAIGKYELALRLNPDDALAHHNLGLSLAATGRSEEALHQYSRALELKPGFLPARLSLGSELLRLKKTDQGAAILEAGLTAGAGVPDLHFRLGQAYEQLGRGGDAEREYQETLRLNPTNGEAQNALARVRASR
jgi:tetratricopeptide (TPR) repeat protein